MLTVILTVAAALAFILIVRAVRRTSRNNAPAVNPGISQAIFIDTEHGNISEMLVDGNEEIYAELLGCNAARVGVSGDGFIVYVDPSLNSAGQASKTTGFRITSNNSVEFRGNGLIVSNSILSQKLKVELFVKDRAEHTVFEFGGVEEGMAAEA